MEIGEKVTFTRTPSDNVSNDVSIYQFVISLPQTFYYIIHTVVQTSFCKNWMLKMKRYRWQHRSWIFSRVDSYKLGDWWLFAGHLYFLSKIINRDLQNFRISWPSKSTITIITSPVFGVKLCYIIYFVKQML